MTDAPHTRRSADDQPSDGRGEAETGYGAALAELEAILAQLDRPDVDVDDLAEKVQRASVLIRLCRERIAAARVHIEQVITDLDG